MSTNVQGYVALLLHAHIPYVRHHASDITLEERWFFEAVVDTYLPLIDMMEKLIEDEVPFRLTLSLSPPLLAMLEDSRMHLRLRKHLSSLCELGQREVIRLWGDEAFGPLAKLYADRYHRLSLLYDRLHGDLIAKFRSLSSTGCLELITCAATHAFLPLVKNDSTLRAQLESAVQEFRRHFGVAPAGIWLPECGYSPALEPHLQALDLRYFIVDTHAHTLARRDGDPDKDIAGLPLRTPSGACAFARDPEAGAHVWSAEVGYPGDPDYREYYRDIGHDLGREGGAEWAYLKPYVLPDGARINTGFKYYSVTGNGDAKVPYNPARAAQKAQLHAEHFIASRVAQVRRLAERRLGLGAEAASAPEEPYVIVCPYDAELLGHWWYEGHQWLEAVLRGLAARSDESVVVQTTTLGGYAAAHAPTTIATLPVSSWGRGGYAEVWLQPRSQWVTPRLHAAEDRMVLAAQQHQDPAALSSVQLRALNQAARELMLAQSSDWTFILDADTVTSYATKRIETHLSQFHNLMNTVDNGGSDKELATLVHALERKTPFLPELHYRLFQPSSSEHALLRASSSVDSVILLSEVAVASNIEAPQQSHPSKLRILMLAWEYPPHVIGGLARAVCDLSRGLAADGHSVHVITCQSPGSLPYEVSEGVHIHRAEVIPTTDSLHFLDRVFQMNMAFTDLMLGILRQGIVFDLVHAHDWLVYYTAHVAKHQVGLPLLATIHATETGRNLGKLESPLQKRIHTIEGKLTEAADHLIVCSLSMGQEMKALFHIPIHQITVIPNSISPLPKPDPALFTMNPLLANAISPTEMPQRVLAFLGRLVYEKGVHTLLAAMPQVLIQYPDAKLVIAGMGPERDALEELAFSFGDRVSFTGFLDEADKSLLLQRAEICIFPSLYEPFGIVALEAMASGTPLIVSDTGGLAEIVSHGVNGCTCPPGDKDALAAQIIQLLEQPQYASKLAATALRTVHSEYNWKKIGYLTTHVYEAVISNLAASTNHSPHQKEIIK
ncbi:1,4-alpha-glucan branching protein domain-containing protein [Paenibacillus sp. 2RAB27]|uniref:1,4-alpha-glucan branching protein domain-containing protein n=1 Tax=Paenibacillus sp. 2RAB27 TaxID=3232991 RepID=UPI003F9C704B